MLRDRTANEIHDLSIDKDDVDVHQTVSGDDYRTFIMKRAWKDQNRFYWRREGLYTFTYRGYHKHSPSEFIALTKRGEDSQTGRRYTLQLRHRCTNRSVSYFISYVLKAPV